MIFRRLGLGLGLGLVALGIGLMLMAWIEIRTLHTNHPPLAMSFHQWTMGDPSKRVATSDDPKNRPTKDLFFRGIMATSIGSCAFGFSVAPVKQRSRIKTRRRSINLRGIAAKVFSNPKEDTPQPDKEPPSEEEGKWRFV